MKATELRKLLNLADVQIEPNSRHTDLWRLCLENKLVDREFVSQTNITVVKSSMQCAMTLSNSDFNMFSEVVEEYVSIISRLLRRASLVFHYHILRLEEENIAMPNLYKVGDTYWKHWLKIGLQTTFPDVESANSYKRVKKMFDEPSLIEEIQGVKYFDQILNYAGHTFQTAIENNAWYPLFDKCTRLSKLKLAEWGIDDIKPYTIVRQIRSPIDELDTTLPDVVLEFIRETKAGLLASDNDVYIEDKHAMANMTFHQAFKFNMWMQEQFSTLEARMTRLSPTFSVSRAHIRLDVKSLTVLFKDLFPEHDAVKKYIAETNLSGLIPEPLAKRIKSECNAEEWELYKTAKKEHDLEVKRIKASDVYKERRAEKASKIPLKKLLPVKPQIVKKKKCTEEEWKAYQVILKKYQDDVVKIKTTNTDYLYQNAINEKNQYAQKSMVASFFKGVHKKDWTFDCSVQPDGVSLSRQFSKKVIVENRPCDKIDDITIVEEYNKNLSCFIAAVNRLVIGLDPGRVNLACLSYIWIKDNGEIEKNSWSLTRAQYYNDSGIYIRGKKKAIRFGDLVQSWSKLGTLKATRSSEIIHYVEQYNKIKEDWWTVALRKRESRSALDNYSGKKKVLDQFFANVKKTVKELHPGVDIVVAYGSAFNGMSPSGRGEKSAPVSATYKTCCRHFETQIENEDCSTKTSFETGQVMEKVYKTFWEENGTMFESYGHCPRNVCPKAKTQDAKDILDAYYKSKKKKKRWLQDSTKTVEDKRRFHFPVIRGLQFCPETCMYVDRDKKASLTIARLAVMRMVGNKRPIAFVKRNNNTSNAGEEVAALTIVET